MNLESWNNNLIDRYGKELFEKIVNAKVAIAGIGGMGSNVAVILARLGIGHLHIVDFDVVELSNINRQVYTMHDIGNPKTISLLNILKKINPFIKITFDNTIVDEKNIVDIFKDYKYICECFDKAENKAFFTNEILEKCPDSYIVACSGMAGLETSNTIKTRKITSKFYVCGDEETDVDVYNTIMSPRVAICAGHQANMMLRLINKNS